MKFVDDYRDKELVSRLAEVIHKNAVQNYTFMEVCGGHTAAIHRFGIPSLLPASVKLISGPGCPVCVTDISFIDKVAYYARMNGIIIATFGDLIRVPGYSSSLEKEKSSGADIRIVLSAHEALNIARINPDRTVIFAGIGFETTAPGSAVTIRTAYSEHISNFCVLSAHKVMPPAMQAVISGGTSIKGFICPGHVATITGSAVFDFIPDKYRIGCVVSGFEPVDIMLSVLMLILQSNNNNPITEIEYRRAVSRQGNVIALENLYDVFEPCDSDWRGLGTIKSGGLAIKKKYRHFDAEMRFPLGLSPVKDNTGCICGEILRGSREPENCPLFATKCLPDNPVGACMVSPEGTCNTWYKYRKHHD